MTPETLRFGLLGGPVSLPWCAALPAILPCATTRSLPLEETHGLLIVGPLDEQMLADARNALLGGKPSLCLAATQLEHEQISDLCDAARESGALLRFAPPWAPQQSAGPLRRMLAGDEPMFRPRYVRVLRLATSRPGVSLSTLLNEELAWIVELLGPASRVLILTDRSNVMSSQSAFVTVDLESATRVHCTVSLAEGTDFRQVVVAAGERALTLEDLPPSRAGPEAGAAFSDELALFCQAVRRGDCSPANFSLWRDIAALWAAASESTASRSPVALRPFVPAVLDAEPPLLRIIEGGGRRTQRRGRRPRLTLVPA